MECSMKFTLFSLCRLEVKALATDSYLWILDQYYGHFILVIVMVFELVRADKLGNSLLWLDPWPTNLKLSMLFDDLCFSFFLYFWTSAILLNYIFSVIWNLCLLFVVICQWLFIIIIIITTVHHHRHSSLLSPIQCSQ